MRPVFVPLAVFVLVSALGTAYAAEPEVVLDVRTQWENTPGASDGYLVWSAASADHLDHSNSYVMADGGSAVRVNHAKRDSRAASIDGTTVVYQESRGDDSDLFFFDAVSHARTDPPDGVNTSRVEYRPTLSGDWLLFTRNNGNRAPRHKAIAAIILFNTYTSEKIVLERSRMQTHYLISDQVNGDWATYESCDYRHYLYSNCHVSRYQISTDELVQVESVGGIPRQQYAAGVSSDGTIYMVRTRTRDQWECGNHSTLIRYPVGGPGVVIAKLPVGFDSLNMFALDETDGSTTLYFDRVDCGNGRTGIYRITDADTATM
jgi:hypothetical protein